MKEKNLSLNRVTSLPRAPVGRRVEEMPSDFHTDYLDAVCEANGGLNTLRKITQDAWRSTSIFNAPYS
jgi:hypothetical protein